jgi:two-component system CheB/CheR fusion protein
MPRTVADAPIATRVVGVGASAGGLAALEDFLGNVPRASGLAFVVVQHLDPTQKAMLSELLQRVTSMRVTEATTGMRVLPDHVYVIAPNTELRLSGDVLQLEPPSGPRGLRLPIDVLFSSLARSRGERAVAVVLSGMGADGTHGLQAVKAVGGLTAAQQPETAAFSMMPHSAIDAGCVDLVAPAAELPARILACLDGPAAPDAHGTPEPAASAGNPLDEIVELLRLRTRHDFSSYKPNTIQRRVERRIAVHALAGEREYAEFLRSNPQEIDLLFKELLIGVTRFFRDPTVWDYVTDVALPDLIANRPPGHDFRAWCIGCSTGEEAYSLAIAVAEAAKRPDSPQLGSVKIFASDLNPDAIAFARQGRYPASIAPDVGAERLARWFVARDGNYHVAQSIRDTVLFAQHDVAIDPPFTKLDVLVCRNLLIYFGAALQRNLVPLFHYSLRPGGLLLLGSSETVGKFANLFTSRGESSRRLYVRTDVRPRAAPEFLMKPPPKRSTPSEENAVPPSDPPNTVVENLQSAADRVLLQAYSPAAVVVNAAGDIVYISGRTGKYLEPAAGKANWNFHAMVRDGLRAALTDALADAPDQAGPAIMPGLRVETDGGIQIVDVTVQALREPTALQGMTMVVFRDVELRPPGRRRRGAATKNDETLLEIERLRAEIRRLEDESRTSREELQSANEELQSTNEELQSTNEELTTSKEEMQSMNEELQTINAELQAKLDDLALAQSDMQNLLNSTDIAILFLDQNLHVRRFTERAAKIINVRESDVGRPISDLTTTLRYPTLHEDASATLRTLAFVEKQIEGTDGRRFTVRIMPYRRVDNMIDGVVITFVEA